MLNRSVLLASVCLSLAFSAQAFAKGDVVVDVGLSPAGDFKAKTKEVTGQAIQLGDKVTAENIVVKLDSLDSGISLRDKHGKEKYLETKKFPDAVLVKAIGKGGKGEGIMKIRGIEKKVTGTYKTTADSLSADFPLKLSDYGIKGIKYMGIGVNDQVTIHVTVPLVKK